MKASPVIRILGSPNNATIVITNYILMARIRFDDEFAKQDLKGSAIVLIPN